MRVDRIASGPFIPAGPVAKRRQGQGHINER
jgi:hypothetical protein